MVISSVVSTAAIASNASIAPEARWIVTAIGARGASRSARASTSIRSPGVRCSSVGCRSAGSLIGRMPMPTRFERWMRSKLTARTARMPRRAGPFAAQSRDGVHPVAVLSGNRNFPGRVHAQIEAGFLASPPLVVAYALAGDVARNILTDPIGETPDGTAVRLADLWPSGDEIDGAVAAAADPADYAGAYEAAEASDVWRKLDVPATPVFPWDEASTYIRRPPFAW